MHICGMVITTRRSQDIACALAKQQARDELAAWMRDMALGVREGRVYCSPLSVTGPGMSIRDSILLGMPAVSVVAGSDTVNKVQ